MKKIIVTVGPSFFKEIDYFKKNYKNLIFRINGAHGSIDQINQNIDKVKKEINKAKILVDLPGNKIRTFNLKKNILLKKQKKFSLKFSNTNFYDFYKYLKVGDTIWANDSTYEFKVLEINENLSEIVFLSKSEGYLINNKGMHVRGIHKNIPFLFDKDKKLIELSNRLNIDYVGLSFVRNELDVKEAKKLLKSKIKIISKIETISAVKNLKKILNVVDNILVDRGDLSTEVGFFEIPKYQEKILKIAKKSNKKVFLATQFLKNMEINPIPSIPEVIDLYKTIALGVHGIQLSEETAIGKYPSKCVSTLTEINKIVNRK